MNRKYFLSCINQKDDYMDAEQAMTIIEAYMKEKGTSKDKIDNIKFACSTIPTLMQQSLRCCIEYYKIKFNVIQLTDARGVIIKYY